MQRPPAGEYTMANHQDGVIEAARKIDNALNDHVDNRAAGLAEVNNYLIQNPTLVSDSERAKALSQQLASRGDLPDTLIGEFTKSAADRANDPLAKLLPQDALGKNESEIQKNAKALAEGQAAKEALTAFTPDEWNKMFKNGSASHDDVKKALNDQSLNLNTDQVKALTDLDANFDALRYSGWHFWSDRHNVTRDRLQEDLDKKDDGLRGKEVKAVEALTTQAQQQAKDGTVTVNVESGEGWQNVAAKALGYDIRLRTQDDWKAVPQMDINKIYGLANYFANDYASKHRDTMLHAGKRELKVPENFQTT